MLKLIPTALVFCILSFSESQLTKNQFPTLYIWSVGQGSWATAVEGRVCYHFDMGGEKTTFKKIKKLCGHRKNFLMISHSDKDHISFIWWGLKNLPHLCLLTTPRETLTAYAKKTLSQISACRNSTAKNIMFQELQFQPQVVTDKNYLSRVFVLRGARRDVLIPGDSTSEAEKLWVSKISPEFSIKLLLLGHHGSRTSTSDILVKKLQPALKFAVASARKRRYGHPHPIVIDRLKSNGVSATSTETWGTIIYEL